MSSKCFKLPWFQHARKVLMQNSITSYVSADSLRQSINIGREKNVNIMSNSDKSFSLNPLELMFKCFVTLQKESTHGWV